MALVIYLIGSWKIKFFCQPINKKGKNDHDKAKKLAHGENPKIIPQLRIRLSEKLHNKAKSAIPK